LWVSPWQQVVALTPVKWLNLSCVAGNFTLQQHPVLQGIMPAATADMPLPANIKIVKKWMIVFSKR
jgi:hypothetical protein